VNEVLHRWKAVVVEDDLELKALLAGFLEAEGCEVKRFFWGHFLMQYLGKRPRIDLVICDLLLPGLISGVECVRAIHSAAPEAPILVISEATDSTKKAALKAGATLVINKPIKNDLVIAAIRRALLKCKMNHPPSQAMEDWRG
jgi:DNA-binding response OmpR family regulator